MTLPKIVRNLDAADMRIRKREPFQTRARRTPYGTFVSLSGVLASNPWVSLGRDPESTDPTPELRDLGTGHLPGAYIASFLLADFIVYSFGTPIAWHTDRPHELAPDLIESWLDGTSDGVWVMPEVRYTVTTTSHQSAVRGALMGLVAGWWANNGGNRLPTIPHVALALAGAPERVEGVGCERYAY